MSATEAKPKPPPPSPLMIEAPAVARDITDHVFAAVQPCRLLPAGPSVAKYNSPTVHELGIAPIVPLFAGSVWPAFAKVTVFAPGAPPTPNDDITMPPADDPAAPDPTPIIPA